MRKIICLFILLFLTLVLLAPNLTAAKIGGEPLTIPYQVKNSDRIIIGTVSGIDTYSNYTIYTITVKEWLYNPLPSETIKVISYIGAIDEKEDEVVFTHLNESALLMLEDENLDKLLFRVFVGKPGKHPISDRDAVIKELEIQGKWQNGNIDTSTNNTTSTVNVGNYSEAVSIVSDGKKVYVTNLGKRVANISDSANGNIYVFDRENNSYIASMPVEKRPWSVAVNPDITKVYLNNSGTVSKIDTANNTDSQIDNVGEWTWAVALNPNGSKVYVADQSSDNLSVINTAANNSTPVVLKSPNDSIFGVAITPDGSKVYVTGSNSVSVIDTSKNTVIASLELEGNIEGVAAINPDGTKVYVASGYDYSNVSVIDVATNRIIATVPIGKAEKLIISPDGSKVYITNYHSVSNEGIPSTGTTSVIDTATNNVVANMPVKGILSGIAINSNGTNVYVASYNISNDKNLSNGTVYVINTVTNKLSATVPVGYNPSEVAVSPDGSKVYVVNLGNTSINSNLSNGSVSVIDTTTNTVIATMPVRILPKLITFSSDGSKAYVANYGYMFIENSAVSVIDTSTNTVIATIMDIGIDPQAIAISSDGSKMYVANYADINDNLFDVIEGGIKNGIVSVIDTKNNAVISKIKVGKNPVSLTSTPDGTKLYVANNGDQTVSVIDTSTNKVTANVPLRSPVAFGKFVVSFVPQSSIEKSIPLFLNETRITTTGSAGEPAIYGDRVVYIDSNHTWDIYAYNLSTHNESLIGTSEQACSPKIDGDRMMVCTDHKDVYMYNLSTQNRTQISTSGRASSPKIYGDRIVWEDDRSESPGIYMYNLSTSKETQITANKSTSLPSIYNTKIVWQQDNNKGGYDLCVYDLFTSKETKIKTKESADDFVPHKNIYPEIYGDKIIWTNERDVEGFVVDDVYMYNLSTSKETRITTRNSSKSSPAIYGDKIVWHDYQNENEVNSQRNLSSEIIVLEDNSDAGIYMYNLTTSNEIQVTNKSASSLTIAIYGDKIAWDDSRNGHYDSISGKYYSYNVYMYDLSTSKETRITNSGSARSPAIYGDRIVYVDNRHGNWDIYVTNLNSNV